MSWFRSERAYTHLLISHEQSDRVIDDAGVKGVALTGLDSIADQFLAKFKAALEALKAGDPMIEETTHGPLSTEDALLQLIRQVDVAVAHGAKLLMGGQRIDRPGSFMQMPACTGNRKRSVRCTH